MEKEIIILTKSKKHSGYCIAGINYSTGEWIRLISNDKKTEGAVFEKDLIYSDNTKVEIYDIIKVNVIKYSPTIVQSENWLYDDNIKWRKIGESNLSEIILKHGYDKPKYIFGNCNQSIDEKDLNLCENSLALINVENAHFYNKTFDNRQRIQINFTYNKNNYYYFKITQENAIEYYKNKTDGSYPIKSKSIVFSLTDKYHKTGKYYKVVAQILK